MTNNETKSLGEIVRQPIQGLTRHTTELVSRGLHDLMTRQSRNPEGEWALGFDPSKWTADWYVKRLWALDHSEKYEEMRETWSQILASDSESGDDWIGSGWTTEEMKVHEDELRAALEDHSDDPPKFDALLALNDNRFYGLPEIERIKVLYTVDPLFRQMMPKERWKVVTFLVMGT